MPTGTLAPPLTLTVLDNNGSIVAGGLVHTYDAGGTTPASVYTDAGLLVAHPNPVVADAAGRIVMYLATQSYRMVVCDADDVALYTVDPVQATNVDASGLGDVFQFGGDSNSPITDTSYPTGDTFDKCLAGSSFFVKDSGDLAAGTYVVEGMLRAEGGGTVTVGFFNLSDGSPNTAIVTLASASTTGAKATSAAITFATAGAAKTYALKALVSAGAGYAWGLRLVKTV